ncbi:MAG: KH domain-containing protein [Candidatus Hodarchaeales archaeon]|jgi:ribosomal RNA assembly protein
MEESKEEQKQAEEGGGNDENESPGFQMGLHVKIPDERVGVLIGKNGNVKKYIQDETSTLIEISTDDGTGSVTVRAAPDCQDPTMVWVARDIVKAIGRGFNEEKACKLLDDDYRLEIIGIGNIGSPKRVRQVKGRLIGQHGKMRATIEETIDVFMSVYGKTVSLIGRVDDVEIAKKAVNMILEGRQLGSVFKFLERQQTKQKKSSRILWELS